MLHLEESKQRGCHRGKIGMQIVNSEPSEMILVFLR